jgi:uncharacterized protein DUF4192
MTATDDATRQTPIRIRRPGELVEAVPYLLGFHPRDSLVIVGFALASADGCPDATHVSVTMRLDLTDDPVGAGDLASLVSALVNAGTESAAVLVYRDAGMTGRSAAARFEPMVTAVSRALAGSGISLMDALVVTPSRWWSLQCGNDRCCPAAGTLREHDRSVTAAAAVAAGLSAFPDRASLTTLFESLPGAESKALDRALEAAENRLTDAILHNRIDRVLRSDSRALISAIDAPGEAQHAQLSDRRLARYAVALSYPVPRDELWLAIDEQTVNPADALLGMARRLPAPYSAAPLFLFGWARWRAGNGALASMAAERAVNADPSYSAAYLLLQAIAHGLDPRTTPTLSAEGTSR